MYIFDRSMPIPDAIAGKTIAFVSNNAWSVYNFRLDVIRFLLRHRAKVMVIAAADGYAEKLVAEGCSFYPVTINNRGANPLKDISLYFTLRSFYRRLKPDFIFHFVAKPNIYGSFAASAASIRSVAVITGLGYPFAKRNMLFYIMRTLYRASLKNAWEVWFLNDGDAQVFIRENIVGPHQVKVLSGEGVNTEFFHRQNGLPVPSSRPFRFIMSARLLKSKGVRTYAAAARLLLAKKIAVDFSLIGLFEKGHPDAIGEDEVITWQREGLLRFEGFAPDVRPHLLDADCLVFPSSYSEGVPRSLLEASAMELPAITTYNRGCVEVVEDEVNGYLCKPNNAEDLALKMEKMMNLSPEQRAHMGKRGRAIVLEKFDVRKIIQEYANTLISAFENHHGSNRQHSRATEDHRRRI